MKAAVLAEPRHVAIEERPRPDVGPQDVLVRVDTCGVCGTDAHIFEGEFLVRFPVVPGHELAGIVAVTGAEVGNVAVGDRVTVDPNIACGACAFCRAGRVNLCENLRAVGVNRDGGFAGYCVAPAKQAHRLPEGVSLEAGAFAEPISCCLHGLDRARMEAGQSVLILGGGAIGQLMLHLCKSAGAAQVMVSEPLPARRELAARSGADGVLDPEAENVAEVVAERMGGGADLCIECAGSPKAAEQAVAAAKRGGTILLFGVASEAAEMRVRPYDLFIRELSLVASFINPFTPARAVEALRAGRVKPEALITHRFPVAGFEEALRTSRGREAVKVVVQPEPGESAG